MLCSLWFDIGEQNACKCTPSSGIEYVGKHRFNSHSYSSNSRSQSHVEMKHRERKKGSNNNTKHWLTSSVSVASSTFVRIIRSEYGFLHVTKKKRQGKFKQPNEEKKEEGNHQAGANGKT